MSQSPRPLKFSRSVLKRSIEECARVNIPNEVFSGWASSLEFDIQEAPHEKLTHISDGNYHQKRCVESYDGKKFVVYWDIEWQDASFGVLDVSIVEAKPRIPKNSC